MKKTKVSLLGLFLLMRETDIRLLTHEYFIIIVKSVVNEKGFCAWVNWANSLVQFPRGGLSDFSLQTGVKSQLSILFGNILASLGQKAHSLP